MRWPPAERFADVTVTVRPGPPLGLDEAVARHVDRIVSDLFRARELVAEAMAVATRYDRWHLLRYQEGTFEAWTEAGYTVELADVWWCELPADHPARVPAPAS